MKKKLHKKGKYSHSCNFKQGEIEQLKNDGWDGESEVEVLLKVVEK